MIQSSSARNLNSTPKKEKKKKSKSKKSADAAQLHTRIHNPERFDVDDDKQLGCAIAHLKEHGYAVLANVAKSDDIQRLRALFWKYLVDLNPKIDPNNPETWTNEEWPSILSVGIFQFDGIGQSEFLWACRTLPSVRRFFEGTLR